MASKISDKSRHFASLALSKINSILEKYDSTPDLNILSVEETALLKQQVCQFYECVKNTNYKKFSFLDEIKNIRNSFIHDTGERSLEENQNLVNQFFSFLPQAKTELEEYIRRSYSQNKDFRQFEKFGKENFGNDLERKQLTQAISDAMESSLSNSEKLDFPMNSIADEIKKFFENQTPEQQQLFNFAKKHERLNEQIQGEILNTVVNAYDETAVLNPKNPFYAENLFIKEINQLEANDLFESAEKLTKIKNKLDKTGSGKDNSTDFYFYKKKLLELLPAENKSKSEKALSKEVQEKIEIFSRNLKADLEKSMQERFIKWQLEEIDKKRNAYLEELYKKISQFMQLEQRLSAFLKFGRLWDMSQGNFDDYGFEILLKYADLLEQDESLKELAELIGKQNSESERYEKELREQVVIKTEYHPKNAYRGQISGLKLSGNISSALPSELALLKNPATKLYFAQKFAEKKLLSYAYINQQANYINVDKKGPVILCIDTSGSMHGTPENVAKTIAFALTKKCLSEERKCFLISFSSGIETIDLSDGIKSIEDLVKFLRMSFNGGTDALPALKEAIKMLSTENYKNADVLMISDFVMSNLDSIKTEIEAEQKKDTKFYSLVIGESGNENAINCFDENWCYDLNSHDSMKHLVRQLHSIRN